MSMRWRTAAAIIAALSASLCLAGADAPALAQQGGGDDAAAPASLADQRAAAAAAAANGMAAMKDADAEPHRAVDAAIAFSRALAIDTALGDTDAVCEMQADIFWCKKRMNLQDLQDYLAHKDAKARADFTVAQAVMDKSVSVDEAATYLDRAEKYRAANPELHYQVAIRYSEVVERFPGTAQASTAAATFAHEQSAYLSQVSAERAAEHAELQREIAHARDTRFTTPPAVVAGQRIDAPSRADRDAALTTVRSLYRAQYARARHDSDKRALARRLAEDAEKSRDNAPAYQAMLEESSRFAEEVEDYGLILEDCDRLAAAFAGPDAHALAKDVLTRMSLHPTAKAILALLENPRDKAANAVVGKYFCYSLGRWEDGLPMLAIGGDAALAKAADMEEAKPASAEEQRLVGDAWYELGKKGGETDRVGAWTRAQHWYQECEASLSGINQGVVQRRLDECERVLPAVITDWSHLTASQWNHIKARVVSVDAHFDRCDGECTLDGGAIRVVPCPDDTWTWSAAGHDFTCDAAGGKPPFPQPRNARGRRGGAVDNSHPQGSLTAQVESGPHLELGRIQGIGHLWLCPENPWMLTGNGVIRVKIVPIDDDQ
jgi:hypothetical protein